MLWFWMFGRGWKASQSIDLINKSDNVNNKVYKKTLINVNAKVLNIILATQV